MSKFKIFNAEPEDYSRKAFAILQEVGEVEEALLNQEVLLQRIPEIDALIVRLGLKVNREVIEKGAKLKYILSATTGTDHIDMEAAKEHNIEVVCLKGEEAFLRSIPSTSEYTWALLLALLRNLPQAYQHVLDTGWDRQLFRGHNIAGKKLGILGLGRVGRLVAGYALAFGCELAAYDPFKTEWMEGVQRMEKAEDLMQWSEILCIHIPYDADTHHFLNENLMRLLPQGALMVNTSRGGVWDEAAIVRLLEANHLGGVATDVIEGELTSTQRNKSPLLRQAMHDARVLVTPHIAGATYESMEMTEIFIAKKFKKRFNRTKDK